MEVDYLDDLSQEELNAFVLEALSMYIGNSLIINGFITDDDYLSAMRMIEILEIDNINHLKYYPLTSDIVKHELYHSLPIEIREIFNEDSIYGYYQLWEQTRSQEYNLIIETLLKSSAGSPDEDYTKLMFGLFDYFLIFYNKNEGRDIEEIEPLTQNGGGGSLSFIAVIAIFLLSFLHLSTSFSLASRFPIMRGKRTTSNKVRYTPQFKEDLKTELDEIENAENTENAESAEIEMDKPIKRINTSQILRTGADWFKHKSLYDRNELVHIISQALPVISKSLDIENCNFVLDCIGNTLRCCNNIVKSSRILGLHKFASIARTIDDWENKVNIVKEIINKTEEKIGYKILTFIGSIVAQTVEIPRLRIKNLKKSWGVKPPRSLFTRVLTELIKISDNPSTRKKINDYINQHRQKQNKGGTRHKRKGRETLRNLYRKFA